MAATLNEEQRQMVEESAWRFRVRGYTIRRIAEEMAKPADQGGIGLRVAISTVDEALGRVAKQLNNVFITEAAHIKAEQTEQLRMIQEESIDAWERSKLPGESEKTVTKAQGAKVEKGQPPPRPEISGMYVGPDGEETTDEEREKLLAASGLDGGFLLVTERISTKDVKYQCGDPRFLEQFRGAAAEIRKIWGLDAPVKQDLTSGGERLQVISYEVLPPAGFAAAPASASE